MPIAFLLVTWQRQRGVTCVLVLNELTFEGVFNDDK